jgi:hypothetical protein
LGCAALQWGHWKSENSTISRSFGAGPRYGPGALLRDGARFGKGIRAKGHDVVAGKDVLIVGQDEELGRDNLLLAGLVAYQQGYPADAIDFSLLDGPHLPDTGLIVAPTGLQKGVDGLLGGRRGGEIGGVWFGKDGRRRGRGRP